MAIETKPRDGREIKARKQMGEVLKQVAPAKVQKPENKVISIIRPIITWLIVLGLLALFAKMVFWR